MLRTYIYTDIIVFFDVEYLHNERIVKKFYWVLAICWQISYFNENFKGLGNLIFSIFFKLVCLIPLIKFSSDGFKN